MVVFNNNDVDILKGLDPHKRAFLSEDIPGMKERIITGLIQYPEDRKMYALIGQLQLVHQLEQKFKLQINKTDAHLYGGIKNDVNR